MPNIRILVIEDDELNRTLIKRALEPEGFQVELAATGEAGLESIRQHPPRLIIIELSLPGINGFDVCKLLKQEEFYRQIPIILISTKSSEVDIVTGLELGADDYMVKPLSHNVLISRIRAVLRRVPVEPGSFQQAIELDNLVIDPARHEVRINESKISLTPTEFQILYFLAKNVGRVFRRPEMLKLLRGNNHAASERAIDVQIADLRRRLGAYGKRIETVRGLGYRLKAL